MRIDRLDLMAFGNFTDASLDFSGRGLQVVYGSNEAGKTTARAAVSNLLYDFDLRTTFAFVHPMNKLQVGALLRSEDAKTLEVVRYKRNKDPLLEAGSGRVVGASEWAGFLQGVTRSDFELMFTLGWDELVQGTADLLARGGLLGETLFAAGLGVRELGSVLERLDSEAAALFSPRPSTKTVNVALKAHAEARKRANELSVKPAHYAEVQKTHVKAVAERARLALQRLELDRDHERLVILRGVLPTLRDRANKLDERAGLREAGPVPPASWATRVLQALESRGELTRQRSETVRQVKAAAERLGELTVDEGLLDAAERVDVLAEGIAGYVDGRNDRGGLDEGRRDAERDALGVLGMLIGGSPGISNLMEVRLVLADKEGFTPARDEWTSEATAFEQARDAVRNSEEEIAEIKDALVLLPEVADPAALRASVDVTLRQGDLGGMLASARTALGSVDNARFELAGRLGLSEDEVAGAVASPFPSAEEVEEILGRLDEAATLSLAADERAKANDQRAGDLTRELEALALEGELPSEEDLSGSRAVRDETWSLVKASWLDHQEVTGEATSYPDDRSLASSYEQSSEAADSAVDHLWREADRTARRNALRAELDRVRSDADKAREDSRRTRDAAVMAYENWSSVWPNQRIPQSPGSLRQWATSFERICSLQTEWTERRLAHREAFRSLRTHRGRLVDLLATFGSDTDRGRDLEPVLVQASALLAVIEENRADRAGKEMRLGVLERELPKRRTAVENAKAAEQAAGARFVSMLGPYGSAVASPSEAGRVIAIFDRLERLLDIRDERLGRMAGIDQRSAIFEAELLDLLAGSPDIDPNPAADAARELVRRLKAARDTEAARQTFLANRASAAEAFEDAETKLTGLRDELIVLGDEGGITDEEMLGAAADRALRIAALSEEIDACDALLTAQGGGRSIADLEVDGSGRDLADVNVEIGVCKESSAALLEQETDATDVERDLAQSLAAMDGSDTAAAEAELAQIALAQAVEAGERYTRVVLARLIADEAIRQYGETHQDPLLKRASRYFELLTEGRCRKVGVDDDPKRGPYLSAIYASGEGRLMSELSDGTRDQLYFALRLAAIEEAFVQNGPMPVVLDDVLVNFDDDRARSALRCLATLAATSQVLLFTHHHHILSLAEDTLSPEEFVAQEIV